MSNETILGWGEQKIELLRRGLISAVFSEMNDLAVQRSDTNFEPLLLSMHAQRLGDLLEKSFAIRKEIRDLEILEVKAAKEFELFDATTLIDEEIDKLRLNIDSKTAEGAGFGSAATEFGQQAEMTRGLAKMAVARQAGLDEDVASSNEIAKRLAQRWEHVRKSQREFAQRHRERGNAHNFGERAGFLTGVLKVQLQEAIDRAWALHEGVRLVYSVSPPAPLETITLANLDAFSMWTLMLLRSLAHAAENESSTDVVVPLVQPWFSSTPLIDSAKFEKQIASANGKPVRLTFELPNNGLLPETCRVRGVGLAFANRFNDSSSTGIDRNQTSGNYTRILARIHTPEQFSVRNEPYRRPTLIAGNVGLHSAGAPVAWIEGPQVDNLKPFGAWSIELHPMVVWKEGQARNIEGSQGDTLLDLSLIHI